MYYRVAGCWPLYFYDKKTDQLFFNRKIDAQSNGIEEGTKSKWQLGESYEKSGKRTELTYSEIKLLAIQVPEILKILNENFRNNIT